MFLKVMRYSTSSPKLGVLFEATFVASISPGTSFGVVTVTFASSSLSYFISALSCPFTATTFLTVVSDCIDSFTFTLNVITALSPGCKTPPSVESAPSPRRKSI